MTEMPPPPPPVYYPPPGVFGTKVPSAVTFGIAVLLFLLPFVEIKCNTMPMKRISGISWAIGFPMDASGSKSILNELDTNNTGIDKIVKEEQKEPNLFAIAALALGIVGFAASFLTSKAAGIAGIVTGVLGAASLVGLFISIKNDPAMEKIRTGLEETTNSGEHISNPVTITLEFTPWFYITVIAFLVAAFWGYKRLKAK